MFNLNDGQGRLQFGEEIKNRRKKLGLSQKELASLCGKQRTAVAQWERGVTIPDTASLKPLCDALQCDLPW